MRSRRPAFSLLEVLVSLAILGVGLGVGMMALRPAEGSLQSRALAQRMASQFRRMRERAMALGIPTAMAFSGMGPVYQSCVRLEGEEHPRAQGVDRWDHELKTAACFTGIWPLDGGQWQPPASSPLDLQTWAAGFSGQPLFAYLPNGTLVSNQSTLDGQTYLVCASGGNYQTSSNRLTAASRPWVVELSPTGEIDIRSGLPRGSQVASTGGGWPALTAPPSRPAWPTLGPQLRSVEPVPVPAPNSLPAGINASVTPGGYITFQAYATDRSASSLICDWEQSSGSFSAVNATRMEWNPIQQQWVSHWTFTPPPGARTNDIYQLTCKVHDSDGRYDTSQIGVNHRVLVTKRQRLAYLSNRQAPNPGLFQLLVCNTDGTERKMLVNQAGLLISPRWSMDGEELIYLRSPAGVWGLDDFQLHQVKADGTQQRLLVNPAPRWSGIYSANYSFDGTRVLFVAGSPGTFELASVARDGTGVRLEMGGSTFSGSASFNGMATHPTTGNLLLANMDGRFFFVDPDAHISYNVSQTGQLYGCEMCFSPDGQWLIFSSRLRSMYKSRFHFDGTRAVIDPPVELTQAGQGQTPSMGMDPDVVYYQRRISPSSRCLARFSLSLDRYSDISTQRTPTEDEDDCCVTNYPENQLP
ncbi:PD40 domain-containing protein [bacterium]|nr:PD40 domain-containing protein [bacterium]